MRTLLFAAGALALAIGVIASTARVGAQTIGVATLNAQGPTAAAPAAVDPTVTFDAAAVKANKSGDGRIMFGGPTPGRFNVTNAPLREIIRVAYQIQPFQLVGGPSWITTDRFDIVAKAPEGTPMLGPPGSGSASPMLYMMRNLLAERFKLAMHNETRDMPIYALVLARSDGKLGPKIQPSTVDCAGLRGRGPGRGGPPGPPAPPAPGERPPCGMMMGPASVAAGGVSFTQLAALLSQRVGRVVVDKTGLSGLYEFNLDFTPEFPQGAPAGGPGGAPPLINGGTFDPNGPSIYTALQEQLGLKLDSQRGPVEVLVIDRVEQPTED
jgi:uncharacterized protein (TIGR03435 family)